MPLAQRMRPRELDEMCGQRHIIGENAPLRKLVSQNKIPNMIFYGPSGTGKTTAANIIAEKAGMTFFKLNATVAGSSDIKDVLKETETLTGSEGILLYLDEIQYLNRKQQQTLLEYIEDGRVTLIASTTENPYFYIYKAILSRCLVFEFKELSPEDMTDVLVRAMNALNEENKAQGGEEKILDETAARLIAVSSGGDVRSALNTLEASYYTADTVINEETAKAVSGKGYASYDSEGDDKFELLSALQKSIRGSDENAAVFYLAKLLESGDLLSPCRRLLVIASEDIGLAYPMAAAITNACVDSAIRLGLPEARIPLAQAAVLLATAPKSNSAYMAMDMALEDVRNGLGRDMPSRLKNNHAFGVGEVKGEYLYPHDFPNHYVSQQYLPDDIKDKKYYTYGDNKTERAAYEYQERVKSGNNKK
ncbi:MAG: replication-associated recombination protein A [Ruminococcaceae bacterium]|nr:replication-associated recombination protein A [Oscillospiraceae bacterium]